MLFCDGKFRYSGAYLQLLQFVSYIVKPGMQYAPFCPKILGECRMKRIERELNIVRMRGIARQFQKLFFSRV